MLKYDVSVTQPESVFHYSIEESRATLLYFLIADILDRCNSCMYFVHSSIMVICVQNSQISTAIVMEVDMVQTLRPTASTCNMLLGTPITFVWKFRHFSFLAVGVDL